MTRYILNKAILAHTRLGRLRALTSRERLRLAVLFRADARQHDLRHAHSYDGPVLTDVDYRDVTSLRVG